MSTELRGRERVYLAGLLYLWSVPLAFLLNYLLNWQYDGDLGWWLVAAYTFPIVFLAEPFDGSVDLATLAACYMALLIGATWLAFRSWRQARA